MIEILNAKLMSFIFIWIFVGDVWAERGRALHSLAVDLQFLLRTTTLIYVKLNEAFKFELEWAKRTDFFIKIRERQVQSNFKFKFYEKL